MYIPLSAIKQVYGLSNCSFATPRVALFATVGGGGGGGLCLLSLSFSLLLLLLFPDGSHDCRFAVIFVLQRKDGDRCCLSKC